MKKLIYIFIILSSLNMFAQDDAQRKLEERKEQLMREKEELSRKLQTQKKQEKSVLKEIAIQSLQIKNSEKIISTIAKQTRILSDDIYLTQLEINKMNRELEVMKEDYQKMIVKSYKSRSDQSKIMFILSSNSFIQAYKRVQYMKQYAGYRKMQAEEIKQKQLKLANAKVHLESRKKEKEVVLEEKQKVKQEQEKIKQEKEVAAKKLQKDNKKIIAQIKAKEKESRDIDRKIRKMIADAIARINKKNAEKAKAAGSTAPSKPISSTKIELTPEGKIESNNFKANKGRLPWPVEKGSVVVPYGDSPHPQFPNLTIHNSGIDIATDNGSSARAVFSGEVVGVQISPNTNTYSVLVRHGDFFTSYSNLSTVSVSKGQQVNTKQALGRIKTNASGQTVIKFMINQNTTSLNPRSWLAPR